MNYYEILGVTDKSTDDEIKRAYRKLASQHHPDRGGDTHKFQEIQAAYDTLSDPGKRQQYDLERNGFGPQGGVKFHWHSSGNGHPDIDAIFRQFGFGADPFQPFRQQQRRNKDLRIEIAVPLVTTLEEQKKTVSVKTTNGESSHVEVVIPRGVTNGTTIRYSGLGDNLFNTLPRGDLYVQINVHNTENFIIHDIDLYTQISVNCLTAITGGSTHVQGIDGKVFELTLPPGTQPNTRFRIHGQGLYRMNTQIRGNLYAEVLIEIPKNLSAQQLEIIQNLNNNL